MCVSECVFVWETAAHTRCMVNVGLYFFLLCSFFTRLFSESLEAFCFELMVLCGGTALMSEPIKRPFSKKKMTHFVVFVLFMLLLLLQKCFSDSVWSL